MEYYKKIALKDGRECVIRNGTYADGQAALDNYLTTHEETDYLLAYPDENTRTAESESEYLEAKRTDPHTAELLAVVDGKVAGTAGLDRVGRRYKLMHRASFGISVSREYWGLGIGSELLRSCIECAVNAGYEQLELDVVADNERALSMYRRFGFTEYGRHPYAFKSRYSGYQELVFMRLDLRR